MNELLLARLQFGITTVYHFFFVPLTLGLSILLAIMQTIYYRTGNETYKRMTKFWGKLFLINFALGVATGIVQEFQFGMNWSEYSRYVGDVFGSLLAIEALLAFFMESTFLGLWVFGWEKLSPKIHLATIWLVAIGSNVSALWILIANSFMQEPVGYVLRNGRAEMTDFFALVFNPHVLVQYPHVLASGISTAAFFVLGISAYHLLKKSPGVSVFTNSFRLAAYYGLIGTLMVAGVGHAQGQHMVNTQPMKMAAAEALWETESPAAFSIISIIDEEAHKDVFSIKVPGMLSIMAGNSLNTKVRGIKDLQAEYEQTYGPGNYVPPITINFWSFRIMVGIGFLMLAMAVYNLFLATRGQVVIKPLYLKAVLWAIALPYIANTTGWLFTELGRQPWIVFGLQKTADAVSPNVTTGMLLFSLIAFTLVYGALMVADVYLLVKFAKKGVSATPEA